jgi:diaminopimelate epimerase
MKERQLTKIIFVRISASENSFLFVDSTNVNPISISQSFGFDSVKEFVRYWTTGVNGLTSDGMVFVIKSNDSVVVYCWDF